MGARGGPVRTRERFLIFGSPLIEEPEIEEVAAALRSGWLGTGPRTARFEEAFRAYKGARHAVAVNSCTAALHLSLVAAGIGPGDEVLVPALTFCSTANAVLHAGGRPVLVDVDERTQNMDPGDARRKLSRRTRALVPVHFAGRPCDMAALGALARSNGLRLIEDCAHAIEASAGGRAAGTFGDFGCFSFYVTKNVVTGEGGMVLARRAADAARIKRLALHGLSQDAWKRFSDEGYRHYRVVELGFKYNMTDLQAALGLHQLARVERNWERRRALWERYDRALAGLPLRLPAPPEPGTRHALHLYTVRLERGAGLSRDAFLAGMTRQGIGVGVHYLSLAEHPFYRRRLGVRPEDYPAARAIGRSTVSLPLSAKLSDRDADDVVEAVRRVLGRSA